jgi:hypothetical protein
LFYGSSRVDLAGSSLYIWDNRHGYISNREIRRGREGRRGRRTIVLGGATGVGEGEAIYSDELAAVIYNRPD